MITQKKFFSKGRSTIYRIKNFNRLNDSYFKYALATEENKNLTIAFINSALRDLKTDDEVPLIEDIIFLDRESSPLWNEAKTPRFDVYASATDGRIFHIEVQVAIDYSFLERSLYYASYDFFMQSKICYFGNLGGKKLMQELAQKNSNVEQLIGIEQKFQTDPILLRRYYFQEKARKDFLKYCNEREVKAHAEGVEKGLEKGLQKGRMEGVREKAILTAKRMLKIGLPIEQISEITDLTQDEISAIEV